MYKLLIVLLVTGTVAAADDIDSSHLTGIYVSGAEIEGYSSTVMELSNEGRAGNLKYRDVMYSDVKVTDGDGPMIGNGECRLVGGQLIIARGLPLSSSGGKTATSIIEVYYPERIKDTIVLFRSDSYAIWKDKRKVYDYGILVRVRGNMGDAVLDRMRLPTVKLSEIFGIKEWKDPFVKGPNK